MVLTVLRALIGVAVAFREFYFALRQNQNVCGLSIRGCKGASSSFKVNFRTCDTQCVYSFDDFGFSDSSTHELFATHGYGVL